MLKEIARATEWVTHSMKPVSIMHYEHTYNALYVVMVMVRIMVGVRVKAKLANNYDYTAL